MVATIKNDPNLEFHADSRRRCAPASFCAVCNVPLSDIAHWVRYSAPKPTFWCQPCGDAVFYATGARVNHHEKWSYIWQLHDDGTDCAGTVRCYGCNVPIGLSAHYFFDGYDLYCVPCGERVTAERTLRALA